jgi:hypothetical protein
MASYGTVCSRCSRLGRTLSLRFRRGFAESSLRSLHWVYLAYLIRSALRSELPWLHYSALTTY